LFAAVTMAMLEEERVDHTVIESVRGMICGFATSGRDACLARFCFRRGDLPRLFAALRFIVRWRCKNGSTFPPDSLMPYRRLEKIRKKLIVVYRKAKLHQICLRKA